MHVATLEKPVGDDPALLAAPHHRSYLQVRFLDILHSIDPLLDALQEKEPGHEAIGNFEVMVNESALSVRGLRVGGYDMLIKGTANEGVVGCRRNEFLVTPHTMYRHVALEVSSARSSLRQRDTFQDIVPHGDVDVLCSQQRILVEEVVHKTEQRMMDIGLQYGIGGDLPAFQYIGR